jgi:hypothetical protein
MSKLINKKTAIVVLGGGLKKGADGKWRTTNYDEPGDKFGILGDRLRVVAASYLYKKNPGITIIASGGHGQSRGLKGVPTVSEVIKRELIEMSVPKKDIVKEEMSGNTYEQLREAKRLTSKLGIKKIVFLSNKWHLPRIKKMFEKFAELKEIQSLVDLDLKDAERILLDNNRKRWQKIIKQAYRSEELKKRIKLERQGIEAIKQGKYKLRKK